MIIKSIKISNILSIENAEIVFDDTGLMLVKGWDYDTGRANGAGKTAIFNALSFALYDKVPRKITASEILRRGCKSGTVEVEIQIGDVRYNVLRSRPKGVAFFAGGQSVTLTQEEFESKLGLNFNQFMMVAYCAQGGTTRFLSVNDSEKKKFLLQLLDLDKFSEAKKKSDEIVKNLNTELDKYNNKLISIISKIEAYSESLVDESILKDKINRTKDSLNILENELIEVSSVSKPDLAKFQALEDDIKAKIFKLSKIKAKRDVLNDEYRKNNSKIKPFTGSTECYACGTHLDTTQARISHDKETEALKQLTANIKQEIDKLDVSLLKEQQLNDLLSKIKQKKKEESQDYDNAQSLTADIKLKIQLNNQKLNDFFLKLQNNLELSNKINSLKQAITELGVKISDIQNKIDLYKTVSALYAPTGAQAYILDSIVDLFNEAVSEYIGTIWNSATYELMSYKEKQDGDINAKFSEKFTVNGKEISIGSLSGGEYRALSLCVDFALISVVERQFGISISPIILDEPFDGLDNEGRELIINLLQNICETKHVIVVDHMAEVKSMFSKILSVEKRNDVSSINLEM